MTLGSIRQPLRMLLLPSRSGTEAKCARALKNSLDRLEVSRADFQNWIELQLENWQTSGSASKQLCEVVQSVIFSSAQGSTYIELDQANKLSRKYFALHKKLMKEHLMTHAEATALLSHSFLIANLAQYERLSAAQISRVLSQRDSRANFSRQNVASVLQDLGINIDFTQAQTVSLYRRDAIHELEAFADADILTAATVVADAGIKLGVRGDIFNALRSLAPTNNGSGIKSPFTPYLQILHYQCTIAEFVDHALTYIYEFKPRGDKFHWLQKKYPHSIAGAGNAFLNNAKSVDVLDIGWVRSKKTNERPGAMALLTILESMEAMGFAARRELAWWIRLWLHRIIRVATMNPIAIPEILNRQEINRLLTNISRGNTKTYGVLEQRTVDAISYCVHSNLRSRGLGDPVNATNISSAKLGDCEYLDISEFKIYAYESHGGHLSFIYIEQHLATVRKSIDKRINELNAITDIENWEISIIFVAHEIGNNLPKFAKINNINIKIITQTFSEFIERSLLTMEAQLEAAIRDYVLTPLRNARNPNEVRQALISTIQ